MVKAETIDYVRVHSLDDAYIPNTDGTPGMMSFFYVIRETFTTDRGWANVEIR